MKRNQKGFSYIEVLLIILVILVIGAVGWYIYRNHRNSLVPQYHESTTSIKPQLSGIINQNDTIPAGYASVIHNLTVEVRWSELQSSLDGPITPDNTIDQAVANAKANNERLFVDIQSGQYAPSWAKNLPVSTGIQGPFQICNADGQTEQCGTMPHWWETNYQNAYANFMSQLAAKYDNVPQIAMIGMGECMTIFNEPMIRQASPSTNIPVYEQAGITSTGDEQCEHAQINAMQPWVHTESFLSFNPYQEWNGHGFTTNEDFTESLMRYCRQTLGQRCVLGNESVGNDASRIQVPATRYSCNDINTNSSTWEGLDPYTRLYASLRCLGPPIEVQGATLDKITAQGVSLTGVNGTLASIPWAISYGVGGFQPPVGYNDPSNTNIYLSQSQIQTYNTELQANSSPRE